MSKEKVFIFLFFSCFLILELHAQDTVRIGAFNYYPAIFKDSDKKIKGFYVDAFDEIAKKEKLHIIYVFGSWKECLERLQNDEIDIMVSVAFSEERAKTMDYSVNPLLTVWGEVYVRSSSEIDGITQLSEKNIAIMKLDMNATHLKDLMETLSISCSYIEVNDFDEVFSLVESGKVDAGVVNNTYGASKSINNGLRSTGIVLSPFDIFITTKKDKNNDILKIFDNHLQKSKHDKNSVFNLSRQKWSHGDVGSIQIIPDWLFYSLILTISVLLITFVFIVLLRYRVRVATKKVLASEVMFKTFMENSTAFVYIKDATLKHIYSNKKVEEIVAQPSTNDLSSANSIFDKKTVELLENADKQILNSEINDVNFIYSCTIKGEQRWLHDYKFRVITSNDKPAVGGIAFDISKLKEIEFALIHTNEKLEINKKELQQKNEEFETINEELTQLNYELLEAKLKAEESDKLKTAFLQNISHEIRTPLNAICGFSSMLDSDNLTEEKKKNYINIILNSSHQLLSIVSDILTISSLETKQEKVTLKKVCINTILIELLTIYKNISKNQTVSIYINQFLSDEASEVLTDKTKITQVLSNLISNALKFTQKGFIEFGYTLIEVNKVKYLQFYVKDSGIGIKPEMQKVIFDRFRQADSSIQNTYGGSGLGLAISKGFIELLGGEIWVESEYEKGATFKFTIPYNPVNEKQVSQSKTRSTNSTPLILIAEDEEFNFLLIEEILQGKNYKLVHAKNGREAVEFFKLNSNNVDLILMDIKMPEMSGDEAARIIKQIKPEIPIIAQSAYALEHEIKMFSNLFDNYFSKPIDHSEFLHCIESYLDFK